MRSLYPPRYGMTRCPHQRVSYFGESVWCRAYNQVSPVSALDIAADTESMELRMSDGVLTPPSLSDLPLLPNNDSEPPIVLPESK